MFCFPNRGPRGTWRLTLCNEKLSLSDRDRFWNHVLNWTFPLFFSSRKRPLSGHVTQSLIHTNQHLNETAQCANDLKNWTKSLAVSLSGIKDTH